MCEASGRERGRETARRAEDRGRPGSGRGGGWKVEEGAEGKNGWKKRIAAQPVHGRSFFLGGGVKKGDLSGGATSFFLFIYLFF